ncbi:MAG: signal peptidase II [Alphaproteobacteria bacterium]
MTVSVFSDLAALPQRRGPLALAALILAADQATKWWIVNQVMAPPRVIEVTPFFNIVMVWNQGVTFGLLGMGGEAMRWLLTALSLAIVTVLLVWLGRTERPLSGLAIGAVIGGALGNVVDRVLLGKVADFLDFHLAGWHWPAFNVADSAIVCGVVLIVFDSFRDESN